MKKTISLFLVLVLLCAIFSGTALPAAASDTISSVKLTGIQFPVVGLKPDFYAEVPGSANYCAYNDNLSWYDLTAKKTVGKNETFVSGHRYYVDIQVNVNSGYEFARVDAVTSAVSATLNGKSASVKKVDGYQIWASILVRYTFPNACGETEISTVKATSIVPQILYNGEKLTEAETVADSFNVTQGAPATIHNNPKWLKRNGSGYDVIDSHHLTVSPGIYQYMIQLRIESFNLECALSKDVKVWIDGKQWSIDAVSYYNNYCLCSIYSPEIVVTEDIKTIDFIWQLSQYKIPTSYCSKPMQPISLVDYVTGGVPPYTFQKTYGPAWMNLSADGTVSGTPTQEGSNDALSFTVTDKNGKTAHTNVNVSSTDSVENWREPVSSFSFTNAKFPSNLTAGQSLPRFTAADFQTTGVARIATGMGSWYRVEADGEWTRLEENAVVEAGKQYCYGVQIRIDANSGYGDKYILANEATVSINGVQWNYAKDPTIGATYSMNYITSPYITATAQGHSHAYTIRDYNEDYHFWKCSCGASVSYEEHVYDNSSDTTCNVCGYVRTVLPTGYTVSFVSNGGSGSMASKTDISGKFTLPVCTFTAPSGMQFLAWAIGSANGPQCMPNTDIFVSKNTAVYAVWTQKTHVHDYALEVINPTCTTPGYYLYTCACGYSYFENEVPATGHRFYNEEWVDPTATTLGYNKHICIDCDAIEADGFAAPTGKVSAFKCKARTAAAETLQWTNVKTASGYQIQISTKDGKKWDKYYNLKAGTAAYTFKSLAAGNNYKFRVRFFIKATDGKNYYSPWAAITSPTLPAGTSLSKVTGAKKAAAVQWKKQANATGYQLQLTTDKNFKKGVKTVTIKNVKTLKATVKKLSAKKTYYVRIRTYKTISKVNYFSTWSKAVKVKTK